MGRGQQRVLAAWDVATHGAHGNVPVAENDARIGFHLHVLHRIALDLGKVAHLLLGKGNVLDLAGREALAGGFDLGAAEAEIPWIPVVELAAVLAHGFVAAGFYVLDDAFDSGTHLGVVICSNLHFLAAFEISDHQASYQWVSRGFAYVCRALSVACIRMQIGVFAGFCESLSASKRTRVLNKQRCMVLLRGATV